MGTILVTGAAGFIGCNFARLVLAETDDDLVVLDKLTYAGHLENLQELDGDPRYQFVYGDIADQDAVRSLLAEIRPRAVVNFAAESHVDRSIDGPAEFLRTNVSGTFALLEASRELLRGADSGYVERFRFIHVSTDEVYGSLGADGLFSETTPYAPSSPYSASKAAADHFVQAYQHTYGLPALITNCSNNYGPFQFPEKLIPLMILNALDGRDLPIYGDGGNVRDWIHVDDHCRGILLALEHGIPGEKYNLGGGNERTNVQVVDAICAALEAHRPAAESSALRERSVAAYTDLQVFVKDRPGHDRRYAIDASKARAEIGWAPRFDFESGLRHTVEWYLEHQDWCAAVSGHERERLGLTT